MMGMAGSAPLFGQRRDGRSSSRVPTKLPLMVSIFSAISAVGTTNSPPNRPTWTRCPPLRRASNAARAVASLFTKSMMASTGPPHASMICLAVCHLARTTSEAPSSIAMSRLLW